MTNNKTELTDFELDDIFASARRTKVAPSDDFMARILADAEDVSQSWAIPEAPQRDTETTNILAVMWSLIGGWAGTGGLAAAAVAGVWLGIAPPDAFNDVNDLIWGTSIDVTLFSSDDFLGLEG